MIFHDINAYSPNRTRYVLCRIDIPDFQNRVNDIGKIHTDSNGEYVFRGIYFPVLFESEWTGLQYRYITESEKDEILNAWFRTEKEERNEYIKNHGIKKYLARCTLLDTNTKHQAKLYSLNGRLPLSKFPYDLLVVYDDSGPHIIEIPEGICFSALQALAWSANVTPQKYNGITIQT